MSSVVQLVRLLQAEFEAASITTEGTSDRRARTAAVSAKDSTPPKSVPTPPPPPSAMVSAVNAGKGEGKDKGGGKGKGGEGLVRLCHKFSDGTGCRFGDACSFKHDRARARKENKCLACGQGGHYRPECTLVAPENRMVTDASSAEGSPKGDGSGKGAPKGKAKAKAVAAKGVTEDSRGAGVVANDSGSGSSGVAPSVNQEQLLAEAAKLLKGVSLKPLRTEAEEGEVTDFGIDGSWLVSAITSASDPRYALVDSGATNALRPACEGELMSGRKIKVDLASGEATLRMNKWGTLLHDGACQVILPAGYLVEMGYVISWKRNECKIKHRRRGVLKVTVVKGCPLIPKDVGLQLLKDYECGREVSASVKSLLMADIERDVDRQSARAWLRDKLLYRRDKGLTESDQASFLRAVFPLVPDELLARVCEPPLEPEGVDWSGFPWNRRLRRSVAKEGKGSVLLSVETRPSSWKGYGRVVQVSDSEKGLGLGLVFRQLMRWAESGVIGGVVKGPSESQECPARGGLMMPKGCSYWDVEGMPEDQRLSWELSSVRWLRMFLIYAVAQAARDRDSVSGGPEKEGFVEPSVSPDSPPEDIEDPYELAMWALRRAAVKLSEKVEAQEPGPRLCSNSSSYDPFGLPVFFLFDRPRDPLGRRNHQGQPMSWAPREIADLVDMYGLNVATFSVGFCGLEGRQSATWLTSSWFMFEQVQGLEVVVPDVVVGEDGTYGKLRQWPRTFLGLVQKFWIRWKQECSKQQEVEERRALLLRISEGEAQAIHESNDHVPYRRGCEVCISSQGRQRSHWRSAFTNIYSASFDLAGPFISGRSFDPVASGRDRGLGYRFLLACSYTVPDRSYPGGLDDPDIEEYVPSEPPPEDEPRLIEVPDDFEAIGSLEGSLEEVPGLKVVDRRVRGKKPEALEPLGTGGDRQDRSHSIASAPIKTRSLFIGAPLRSKKGKEVLGQIQRIINRLESSGYPLNRFHADRAQELKSASLVAWLRDRGIHHTWTPGDTPAGNKAELAVQHLKASVRKLLQVAALPTSFWPLAALHASERNWHSLGEFLGKCPPTLIPFGSRVHGRKRFKTGYASHWQTRTVAGKHLGSALETPGGHLLWVPDDPASGTGKVLLTNTVYPLRAAPTLPKPRYRLSDKRSPPFATRVVAAKQIEQNDAMCVVARLTPGGECPSHHEFFEASQLESEYEASGALSQDAENDNPDRECLELFGCEDEELSGDVSARFLRFQDVEWVEDKVCNGEFTPDECQQVLEKHTGLFHIARRAMLNGTGRAVLCGLFAVGGFHGVTKFSVDHPELTRYLNKFMRHQAPDQVWTTFYLTFNTLMPLHRDLRNATEFPIIARAVGNFKGGGLWIEGIDGDGTACRVLPNGERRVGWVHDVGKSPAVFQGTRWHASEEWFGDRWVISAFVPRDYRKSLGVHKESLIELGFPVGDFENGVLEIERDTSIRAMIPEGTDVEREECWEFDVPCSVFDDQVHSGMIGLRFDAACLCRILSKEISGTSEGGEVEGLLGDLEVAERTRDWYESLLWEDHWQSSSWIVKALNRDVPLGQEDPEGAAEVFLQTRTVSVAEARRELALWIPAAQEEIMSLEETNQAVQRVSTTDVEQLALAGNKILQVLGKAVLTRKAGVGKRRFRCVACGNFVPQNARSPSELYASGVEGLTVRTVLAIATFQGWSALSADIRTAFLHAPLSDELDTEEIIIVKPPALLVEMKILKAEHRWKVLKALYGLRQAPLAWARFRDKSLRVLRFDSEGVKYSLKQGISDDSLWFIAKDEGPDSGQLSWAGILIIYVDDLLGFAPASLLRALFDEIQRMWKLSEPQWINDETPTTFCGIEVQAIKGGGFRISQKAYLQELFTRYEIKESVSSPMNHWSDPEDELPRDPDLVRQAQALTGALLWASTKSRPDVSFAVSKMGQFAVKAPGLVVQKGYQVLKYLFGTADMWIQYRMPAGSGWADAPVPRSPTTLELYTDASHAPEGGRSSQAIVIMWCGMLLCWDASKQPFTTLSSAEAELVAVVAGITAAESVAAILEEILGQDLVVSALCDNSATVRAFSIGSLGWRNRHLRMRAAAGRERIAAGALVMSLIPGAIQVADIGTKPLSRPRILELVDLIGIKFHCVIGMSCENSRVTSRLINEEFSDLPVSPRVLAAAALLAVVPTVRGQPDREDYEVRLGWFNWVVGLLVLVVLGIAAFCWFRLVGRRGLERNLATPDEGPSVGLFEDVGNLLGEGAGSSSCHNGEELVDKRDDDGSDSECSEGGWQEAERQLQLTERRSGLTLVQRARLRRQISAGGIVDPPVFQQRFGPPPSWYTGLDDDSGKDNGVSDSAACGSSLAPQSLNETSEVACGSCPFEAPSGGTGIRVDGSPAMNPNERPSDERGSAVEDHCSEHSEGLVVVPGFFDLFAGPVSQVACLLFGFLGVRAREWRNLRMIGPGFWGSAVIVALGQFGDTGRLQPIIDQVLYYAAFRLVQSGNQDVWMPVEIFAENVGPRGPGVEGVLGPAPGVQTGGSSSGISVHGTSSSPPVPNVQVGGSSSSHGMSVSGDNFCGAPVYEDLFPPVDTDTFPMVGTWLQVHYVVQLMSIEGGRILWFLGDRSRDWFSLVGVSVIVRYAVSGAIVDVLRAGPYGVWFEGPQWFELVERYLQFGFEGVVQLGVQYPDIGQVYRQAPLEVQRSDASDEDDDDPALDERPHNVPRTEGPGFRLGNLLQDEEESSEEVGGSSTAEPSVGSVSASSEVLFQEPEGREGFRVEQLPDVQRYQAADGALIVNYGDDQGVVPLLGWSEAQVQGVVEGLNSGDWSLFDQIVQSLPISATEEAGVSVEGNASQGQGAIEGAGVHRRNRGRAGAFWRFLRFGFVVGVILWIVWKVMSEG